MDNRIKSHEERLRARLALLDSKLQEIEERLDQPMSKDFEEQATEREEDEVLEGLGQGALEERRHIEAALERIRRGTYGICALCEEPISDARLEAVPFATTCRNCMG